MTEPIRPAFFFHPLTRLYDAGCELLGFGRRFKRRLIDLAGIADGERVLEIGCGTGVLAAELVRARRVELVATDADPGALAIARRRLDGAASIVTARAEALPFAEGSFDRVVCTLALHHVPEADKGTALAEARRVLRPKGALFLADFENHRRFWIARFYRSRQPLADWLASAGFAARRVARTRLVHVFSCSVRE